MSEEQIEILKMALALFVGAVEEIAYRAEFGSKQYFVDARISNYQIPEKCKHCGYYYNFVCRAKQCIKGQTNKEEHK